VLLSYVAACARAGLSVAAVSIGAAAALNAWARAGGTFAQVTVLLHAHAQAWEWIVVGPQGVQIVPLALPELPQPTGSALVEWLRGSWESVRELLGQGPPPTRVWVLGESAAHPSLGDALAQACGCAVDVVDPTRVVDLAPHRPASPERLLNACGLALQGLGQAALAVNVLTQTLRRRRVQHLRRAARLAGAVCVAVIISCCASAMWAIWRSRQATLRAVLAQEQLHTRLRPDAQSLLKQQRHLEERLQHLTQLIETHAVLVAAVGQIVEALPDEIWLTKLELSRIGRPEATVEGYAKSFQGMNRLMEQMKATGPWASVKPIATAVTTDATTNQQLIAFTVQAQQ
jgi:Tfp pilus assembly protein PilN